MNPNPTIRNATLRISASKTPESLWATNAAIAPRLVDPDRPSRIAIPYNSTADATPPSSKYFSPASLESRSLWKPTSTYCEMLVSSSARKIPIRSRVPASSIRPAVLKSSRARYSPCRDGIRSSVSHDAPIVTSSTPAKRNWKNSANSSSTNTSSNALRPAVPVARSVAL